MIARTALAVRSADLALLGGIEIVFPTQVDVRAADGSGLGFPTEPNTWASLGRGEVLWLGPDEWLVVSSGEAADLAADLESSLARVHHSVVDVSANRVVMELSDAGRHELLSSACPIDLGPRSWRDGRCAQTLFGAAQVLLQERAAGTRVFVRPSFASYVLDLLLAGVER